MARRWARGVVTAVGLVVVTLGVVLSWPVGPVLADRPEHFRRRDPQSFIEALPPIEVGSPTQQLFMARADGLSEVIVRFGTYQGNSRCTLRVTVSTDAGQVLSSRVIRCADLDDNRLLAVARFPTQDDSGGERFRLSVRALPGSVEAVSLWGVSPIEGLGSARSGQVRQPYPVELVTGYGEDARLADRLGTVLRRMAQYRPIWGQPTFVVAMVLVMAAVVVALVSAPRRLAVAALLLLAATKGLLWSIVLPPLEAPDEVAHYAYAEILAEEGRLPSGSMSGQGGSYGDDLVRARAVLREEAIPPGDRPDFGAGVTGVDQDLLTSLSGDTSEWTPAGGYSPLYYAPAALLYDAAPDTVALRIGFMRLWSVALGVMSAWLAFLIGRRLFPRSQGAALALALAVVLQPMFSQATASINNDAAVITLGFLCILAALELARSPDSRWLPLGAGLAVGLAALAKPFGLVLAPLVAAGWLVGQRQRPSRAWADQFRDVALGGLGLVATYGLWVAAAVFTDVAGASMPSSSGSTGSRSLGAYVNQLSDRWFTPLKETWIDRFWGDFSWLDTPLPHWAESALRWSTLAGLVLFLAWLVAVLGMVRGRGSGKGLRPLEGQVARTGLCVVAVASTVVLLHAIEYVQFTRTGAADLLQGRYGLLALPALVALPPLFLRRLVPRIPVVLTTSAMAVGMAALHVVSLAVLVERFYL